MRQNEVWLIDLNPTVGAESNNELFKESAADCFQVRSVSQERLVRRLGFVSEIVMDEIRIGLSRVLSIEN